MKRKKNDRGFTLVEILICLAITAIVGIFLAGFLGPQINIYHALDEQADAKSACNTVFNLVQDNIRNGKDFLLDGDTLTYTLVTASDAEGSTTLTSSTFDGEVAEGYRGRMKITYDLSAVGSGEVSVTVAVMKDDAVFYSMTQSVLCRNAG